MEYDKKTLKIAAKITAGTLSESGKLDSESAKETVDFLYDNDIPVTLLGHVTKGELRLDELVFGHITDYLPE